MVDVSDQPGVNVQNMFHERSRDRSWLYRSNGGGILKQCAGLVHQGCAGTTHAGDSGRLIEAKEREHRGLLCRCEHCAAEQPHHDEQSIPHVHPS